MIYRRNDLFILDFHVEAMIVASFVFWHSIQLDMNDWENLLV